MWFFKGEHAATLDDKSRVVLPAAIRKVIPAEKLEEGLTLVIGESSKCLELHLSSEWQSRVRRLMEQYRPDNVDAREYFRDVMASAGDVSIDKMNRILMPERSRKAAGIENKEVVFIGVMDYVEIWGRERWEARSRERDGLQVLPKPDLPQFAAAGDGR